MFRHAFRSSSSAAAVSVTNQTPLFSSLAPFLSSSFRASSSSSSSSEIPPSQKATPGPYRKVGNIFICHCNEIPAKYTPQINKILRDLRFEFRGQVTVHPDVPAVRERLFRVRHIVKIDMISTDEMKQILDIPEYVTFNDLEAGGLNKYRQSGPSTPYPYLRSYFQFDNYRRKRIADILERDSVELKLLEAKKMNQ